MITPVEIFIARRYMTSKRKIRFINVISYISISGIAIGVAALLIALSVFNGFSSVVTSVLVDFDPHIRIEKKGGFSFTEYSMINAQLKNMNEVNAIAPFIIGKAMLASGSFNRVVFIKGLNRDEITRVTGLSNKMILGELTFQDSSGIPGVIIGLTLADRLSSVVGNDIVVYSPGDIQSSLSGIRIPEGKRFRVTGIYESNNKDYDLSYAFISLNDARTVFNYMDRIDGIDLRLVDFKKSDTVKKYLLQFLPHGTSVSTWFDLHKSLYVVMLIERWIGYILLSLIILVATFNMLGSLTMGVIEKKRDISVLRAMGMSRKNISKIFMTEGLFLGVIGTVIGIIIGLIILFVHIKYNIFPLDTTVYIIPSIPVEIRWTDFIPIAFVSIGLSWFAAWYPAKRASSIVPSEGLRWE